MSEQLSKRTLSNNESSALLKKRLRAAFPGTKFSVRLSKGTAYGNVNISWAGPSTEAVREVADAFQGQGFDGMDDSTYSIETELTLGDGEVVESGLNLVLYHRDRDPEPNPEEWGVEFEGAYTRLVLTQGGAKLVGSWQKTETIKLVEERAELRARAGN